MRQNFGEREYWRIIDDINDSAPSLFANTK